MNTSIVAGLCAVILLAHSAISTHAQVTIPDPGLNAAVREALQKPAGPLTQADLLSLTFLSACCREIKTLQGLEAARNLRILDLHSNSLTNAPEIEAMTSLQILDLFQNRLASFVLTGAQSNLTVLDVAFNSLTQCSLPNGLGKLDTLFLEGNALTNFTLPAGLTRFTQLDLSGNALSRIAFPSDMTNLLTALVFANQLTNVTLPGSLKRLANLDLDFNQLRQFSIPTGLSNLLRLTLFQNQLTNLILPPDITKLGFLDLGDNQLGSLILPPGLTQLSFLRGSGNRLTNLALPEGLTNLSSIFLRSNQLTSLTVPLGLTHLVQLDVMDNQLTSLTLPPDAIQLATLGLEGNPLVTFVLSEPLAALGLSGVVAALQNQGIAVFTYPLAVNLVRPLALLGAFRFEITGPPGTYSVLASTNLAAWNEVRVGVATNRVGNVNFVDATENLEPQKFYRALLQTPPAKMVFIPPTTFTMGTPGNEVNRQPDEGPQTTVTLIRGFWMGKYEVTQREYLAVIGSNPSQFPGDLDRPVETVSWLDATNYCARLTQQALAGGRISTGSRYRLPTEAEWECAARAGTTTRFSYGDDLNLTELTHHAWYWFNSSVTTHPVGQKFPNPWGLFDMEGNVLEWTQDWYGPYPGGAVIDPQGPPSNVQGVKVIRGGAWDSGELDCRSGRRQLKGVHPFITDSIVGFRVVLVTEP